MWLGRGCDVIVVGGGGCEEGVINWVIRWGCFDCMGD